MMKTILCLLGMCFFFFMSATAQIDDEEVTDMNTDKFQNEEAFIRSMDAIPTFPGGDEARIKYLKDHIYYPESAKDNCIEGNVYVSFTIEIDGSCSNVNMLRGLSIEIDTMVERVVSQMPKWERDKRDGFFVSMQFVMSIHFILEDDCSRSATVNDTAAVTESEGDTLFDPTGLAFEKGIIDMKMTEDQADNISPTTIITSKFSFYPNPAADYITVLTDVNKELAEIEILCATGILIKSTTVGNGERLDISDLTAGAYIICFRQQGEVVEVLRLIVAR